MVTKQFVCKNCGHTFTAEVLEKGEVKRIGKRIGVKSCNHTFLGEASSTKKLAPPIAECGMKLEEVSISRKC